MDWTIVFFVFLIAAGITIFVLTKRSEKQQQSIHNYEVQIANQKTAYEKQIAKQKTAHEKQIVDQKALFEKQIVDQKTLYEKQIGELKERHANELSSRDELFQKQLDELQSRLEIHKEELYQKNEKELLIDAMLGIEALNNRFKTTFCEISSDLESVKILKDNIYDIGDSILNDISTAHRETVEKLGVHEDMTVASILADILELMSKR